MNVSLIVAVAQNGVIGKDNDLVWQLPDDMQYFKDTTKGHAIITGRRNYESIPEKYRPLPNRTNIVVTRQPDYHAPGAIVVNSIEKALEFAKQNNDSEPYIIGGGQIYSASLEQKLVNCMHITWVEGDFEGDTFFPEIDLTEWTLISESIHHADDKHSHAFRICVYNRNE